MRCESCGSAKINYERDAILVATASAIEDGTLILDSAPTAERLDGVRLCCSDCGREQRRAQWEDERPGRAPAIDMMIEAEDALDRIAGWVNAPGDCNGGDLVEFVSQILPRTGRPIVDWAG